MTKQETLTTRLQHLFRRMQDLQLHRPDTEMEEISFPQVAILGALARHPGSGVKEIAEMLHVTPPTISVAVRKLTHDGLIERQVDPEDKRAHPLFTTGKGDRIIRRIQKRQGEVMEEFLSGLPPQEQQQLVELLEKAVIAAERKQSG
ncbi:MAG: MarR family transcriptional regulator [Anaerolineales bacterium]|nr:MarR family transcriptional regulator [Anaerolineales bacterium]